MAQCLQFPQRLYAQHAVGRQAQLARQRLDATRSERQAGTAVANGRINQPGPHHAATVCGQQGLRGEECIAVPAHHRMEIRQILLVLEIAQIVTAAEVVADAQQHPLVADFEHVRAGNILAFAHAEIRRETVVQQRSEVSPVLEVRRLHQLRILPAAQRVVGVAVEPAIRIPVAHLRFLSGGIQRIDRHRPGPLLQIIVQRKGQLVSA